MTELRFQLNSVKEFISTNSKIMISIIYGNEDQLNDGCDTCIEVSGDKIEDVSRVNMFYNRKDDVEKSIFNELSEHLSISKVSELTVYEYCHGKLYTLINLTSTYPSIKTYVLYNQGEIGNIRHHVNIADQMPNLTKFVINDYEDGEEDNIEVYTDYCLSRDIKPTSYDDFIQ